MLAKVMKKYLFLNRVGVDLTKIDANTEHLCSTLFFLDVICYKEILVKHL